MSNTNHIAVSQNINQLADRLITFNKCKAVKNARRKNAHMALMAAPATIAFALHQLSTERNSGVVVNIICPDQTVMVDKSNWLALTHLMLGWKASDIRFVLVGTCVGNDVESGCFESSKSLNDLEVRVTSNMTPDLGDGNEQVVNIVLGGLLNESSESMLLIETHIQEWRKKNAQVIIGSYTGPTGAVSQGLMELRDIGRATEQFANPFALPTQGVEVWCCVLQAFGTDAMLSQEEKSLLRRELNLARATAFGFIQGQRKQMHKIGAVIHNMMDRRHGYRFVMDGWYQTPDKKELIHPENDERISWPPQLIDTPRSEEAIARMAWVACVCVELEKAKEKLAEACLG